MPELADGHASGACALIRVWVRLPPSAPCAGGETGIHAVLRRLCRKACRFKSCPAHSQGRVAQLVRANGLHPLGHRFEPYRDHYELEQYTILFRFGI